jgi:hypothetical protein
MAHAVVGLAPVSFTWQSRFRCACAVNFWRLSSGRIAVIQRVEMGLCSVGSRWMATVTTTTFNSGYVPASRRLPVLGSVRSESDESPRFLVSCILVVRHQFECAAVDSIYLSPDCPSSRLSRNVFKSLQETGCIFSSDSCCILASWMQQRIQSVWQGRMDAAGQFSRQRLPSRWRVFLLNY